MKPFNTKEYNDNPSKKVVTRDGRPVRILCTNAKRDFPVIGLITVKEGNECIEEFKENGKWSDNPKSELDLFFEEGKREGWVNIYKIPDTDELETSIIFSTKEDAKFYREDNPNYVATTKIEWKE